MNLRAREGNLDHLSVDRPYAGVSMRTDEYPPVEVAFFTSRKSYRSTDSPMGEA